MKIIYTQQEDDSILIKKISEVKTWKEIEDDFGDSAKYKYLEKFPFYNRKEDENGIITVDIYTKDLTGNLGVSSLTEGAECTIEEFTRIKWLIVTASRRLLKIVNYKEKDSVWDSSHY